MEGFNDVWANILNGDIINNSENISEHPSLAITNQNLVEKKADLSTNQQMMGDISAINQDEAIDEKSALPDISKEEGQILEEMAAVLDNSDDQKSDSKAPAEKEIEPVSFDVKDKNQDSIEKPTDTIKAKEVFVEMNNQSKDDL